MSAERKLDLGLDQRPTVRKKSLFGHIFANEQSTLKQDITGVETISPAQRQELYRFGVWHNIDRTAPGLKRWLVQWMRRGGIALL